MKTTLLLPLLLCAFLVSCTQPEKTQTIKVRGQYAIDLPQSFTEARDLNKDASLQYSNTFKEFYIIVIDEPIAEYNQVLDEAGLNDTYTKDLEGYSKMILDRLDPSVAIDSLPEFEEGTISNLKSRTVSVRGVSQGHDIYWKFAFIEGKNTYYQVMTWTLADNRKKYEKEMDAMINSFKETNRSVKE